MRRLTFAGVALGVLLSGIGWLTVGTESGATKAERQRAHLTKVLEINPNHQQARRLLGYQWVDGARLSHQEIARAKIHAKQAVETLGEWKPKLKEIRAGLKHPKPQPRKMATEHLLAIDDPAAISLARLAVFTPWKAVREAAAERLRSRDLHSYSFRERAGPRMRSGPGS